MLAVATVTVTAGVAATANGTRTATHVATTADNLRQCRDVRHFWGEGTHPTMASKKPQFTSKMLGVGQI